LVSYQVLVADDHDLSRRVVRECLEAEGFEVETVCDGAEAWAAFERPNAPQIAILDWNMPGLDGASVCRRVRAQSDGPRPYILLLSALSDVAHITDGLCAGADDYIGKPFDLSELVERVRVGCRLIDRERALQHAQAELKAEHDSRSAQLAAISVTDELTQLNNRRGFMSLAEQHARLALRRSQPFSVAFLDLNGLKAINDQLGHETGDQAIREAAEVLRRTVRDADILARLGGDEFVALLDGPPAAVELVFSRLRRELEQLARDPARRYRLSISYGAAFFDPQHPKSVDDLLAAADQKMYERKRERRTISGPIIVGSSDLPWRASSVAPAPSTYPTPSVRLTPVHLPGKSAALLEHLLRAWSVHRPQGFAHAQRTMAYAQRFAVALGDPQLDAEHLSYAAAVHDIGELSVPEVVLSKQSEQELMQRHTWFGEHLLSGVQHDFYRTAASVVRHHHERWDGRGYPNCLVGAACPREARIVGMLDAYDHLRHPETGQGLDDARIADYFGAERGRRFDPKLVDCLLEVLGDLRGCSVPNA
jgi:two-component system cell cycle response regulator